MAIVAAGLVAACVLSAERRSGGGWVVKREPPPSVQESMEDCMRFASKDDCEDQLWGGNGR